MTNCRAVIYCAVVVLGAMGDRRAFAQDARPAKAVNLLDKLATVVETKDLTEPISFSDMLSTLMERCAAQDVQLLVLVDLHSFKEANPDAPSPLDAAVQLRGTSMTVGEALQMATRQLPDRGAILLRRGVVEIVTREASQPDVLLQQKVLARCNKTPLAA